MAKAFFFLIFFLGFACKNLRSQFVLQDALVDFPLDKRVGCSSEGLRFIAVSEQWSGANSIAVLVTKSMEFPS